MSAEQHRAYRIQRVCISVLLAFTSSLRSLASAGRHAFHRQICSLPPARWDTQGCHDTHTLEPQSMWKHCTILHRCRQGDTPHTGIATFCTASRLPPSAPKHLPQRPLLGAAHAPPLRGQPQALHQVTLLAQCVPNNRPPLSDASCFHKRAAQPVLKAARAGLGA